jgi:hypothetical protein
MSTVKKIKPLENYSNVSDADIVSRGTAVQTNMTGNSHFPNPPADLAALKTAIDILSALIAQALDGSKNVIAQKSKQREAVIKMLRLLGRCESQVSLRLGKHGYTDWSDSVTFICT